MDTQPESAAKPTIAPEVAELIRMMSAQQERIITANRESMTGLLQELKQGRRDQIDKDNEERERVAEEMAERERVQKDLQERQLALREEELRTAQQAEEKKTSTPRGRTQTQKAGVRSPEETRGGTGGTAAS